MALFQGQRIRRVWDNKKELWYFSIVDVIGVLTESENPNNYWKVLKSRLKKEGSELVTKYNQLKLYYDSKKLIKARKFHTKALGVRKGLNNYLYKSFFLPE